MKGVHESYPSTSTYSEQYALCVPGTYCTGIGYWYFVLVRVLVFLFGAHMQTTNGFAYLDSWILYIWCLAKLQY